MSEEQQQQQKEVVITGPGEILKKAREAANLSTDDIAVKIRLKKTLIEELEQDNYDINISLTFIKGYLKLYAKRVNVSEDEIVAAFDALNTQKKEPAKLQSFSRRFNHQANDDKLMLVTYLIVAVVIALAVVWWFQQSETEISLFSDSIIEQSEEADEKADNVSLQPYSDSEVSTTPENSELDILADELPVASAPDVDQVDANTIESADIQDPSIVITDEALNETENNQVAVETVLNTAQTQSEVVTDFSDVEPVELVFEFLDNCWTNISDATGEDIAYGVKVKGRVMPITGIPPFIVTLGAPEVVKISYDGQPVDMSFIAPGRSAKFELPLSE